MEEGYGNEMAVITSIKTGAPALTFFSFTSNSILFVFIPPTLSITQDTPCDTIDHDEIMNHNNISHKTKADRRNYFFQ